MFVVAPHKTALRYEICVLGRLDQRWADWFDGFEIVPCGEQATTMVGRVADQAALHGFLNKIRDLGLTLLTVRALEGDTDERIGANAQAEVPVRFMSVSQSAGRFGENGIPPLDSEP